MPLRSQPRTATASLVEHRTSKGGEDLRLSVYDTTTQAHQIALRSTHPMYCGMVTGKKVIHLSQTEHDPFDFVPGESLVVPPLQTIHIDFPEADRTPTRCLTLEIDPQKVDDIVARLNESMPRSPASGPWDYDTGSYAHFANSDGIERVLASMLSLFTEDVPHRDLIIDLNASELIVRMLQAESRVMLLGNHAKHAPNHGLAAAVQYVKDHLSESITVEDLAEIACMSTSTFYRYFRNEFGMTPLEFMTQARMDRAQTLLQRLHLKVADVSAAVGFKSTSHFIRVFKSHAGLTPKQYQLRHSSEDAQGTA